MSFVACLKGIAVSRVVKNLPVGPNKAAPVGRDQIIRFSSVSTKHHGAAQMRLVGFYDHGQPWTFQILPKSFEAVSTATAVIYTDRWAVEGLFAALRQNLIIKNFVGTMSKGVKIPVWSASI